MQSVQSSNPPPPQSFRARYRILVVDDCKDAVDSLRVLLKILGAEVRIASDGIEALEVAEEFLPQVIVLDIGLPKLDGYHAAERIRQRDWGKGIVLVALSGWCRDEDRQHSEAAGFDGHLAKPVRVEVLRDLIERLLDDAA